MAVSKGTRSKSPTQINAQPKARPQPRRRSGPDRRHPDRRHSDHQQNDHRQNDHQRKAEFFEALQHLNRGYGIALSALERLETKDRQLRPLIFPAGCLRDYRNRTEALRAVANRDLLRILAGREDRDAARFAKAR
jgi:hypothetical protein